jgi:hypothetical protein
MDVIDADRQPARRRRILRRPAILAALVASGLALAGVFASSALAGPTSSCWCSGQGGGAITDVWGWGFDGSAWGYANVGLEGQLKGTVNTKAVGDNVGELKEWGRALIVYATAQVSGEGELTACFANQNVGCVYGEPIWFQGTFNETGYSGTEVITGNSPAFKMYLTETNGVIYYTVTYYCGNSG